MRGPLGRHIAAPCKSDLLTEVTDMRHLLASLTFYLLATGSGWAQSRQPAPQGLLVQEQFDAYNRHDASAMAQAFAPVFHRGTLGDTLAPMSRDTLASKMAAFFAQAPRVHAELVSRIVHGAFVIDHEHVTGLPGSESSDWVMIYEVRDGQILRNWIIAPPPKR